MKKTDTALVKRARVAIAYHEAIPVGPAHDLQRYLCERTVGGLLLIAHPLVYNKEFYKNSSRYERYECGKLFNTGQALHWQLPDFLLYIKDLLYTLLWCLRGNKKYDVFIGLDPLNALAGLILKRIGGTQKVVFYTIDYFTNRFEHQYMNRIYHGIDKLCVRLADETWNLSSHMQDARKSYNAMGGTLYQRQITVPISVAFSEAKRKRFEVIHKKKLIFAGYLVPILGVDLIIRAMPKITQKIPGVTLEILGNGPQRSELEDLVKKLKVSRYVSFLGWVTPREKLNDRLSDAAIGLAPFNTNILRDEIKNADPAKLKDYMLMGLPVIITNAATSHKEIERAKCGIVIPYDVDALAEAVIRLLSSDALLRSYRENALTYVKQFDRERILGINISRILQM